MRRKQADLQQRCHTAQLFVDSSLPHVDEDTFDGVETAPNSHGRDWVEMSPCATVPLHVFVLVWFYLSRRPWGRHEGFTLSVRRGVQSAGGGSKGSPTMNERKPETKTLLLSATS